MQNDSGGNKARSNNTHLFLCLLSILSPIMYTGTFFFPNNSQLFSQGYYSFTDPN
jgi:hypothetical protein